MGHSTRRLGLQRMRQAGRWTVAGTLGLVVMLFWGSVPANGSYPVRSVLEIRLERVMIQKWDLSCGAAALGTLLRYQFGEPVTEKEIARGLMNRTEYIKNPNLLQAREGFSLLDLKRFVQTYHARRVVAGSPKGQKADSHTARLLATDSVAQRETLDLRVHAHRERLQGRWARSAQFERPDRTGPDNGANQCPRLQPLRRLSRCHAPSGAGCRPGVGKPDDDDRQVPAHVA